MSFHPSFLFGRSSLLYVSPCWKAMVCLPLPVQERQELLLYTGRQHIWTSFCNSLSDAPVGLCLLIEWHKKWGTRILLRLQKRPYPRASEDLALLFLLKDSHCASSFLVLSSSPSTQPGSQTPIHDVALHIFLIILYFCLSKSELVSAFYSQLYCRWCKCWE